VDFYFDGDEDGWGDLNTSQCTCDDGGSDAWVTASGDCDDSKVRISPDGIETCTGTNEDPADEDCDGQTDEDDASDALIWYADIDGDGYGDPDSSAAACSQPLGYVSDTTDCDDGEPAANPGALEDCATPYDDDCDGDDNDLDATGCVEFYGDGDGDGYGDGAPVCACEATSTHTAVQAGDCDDASDLVNPGKAETCVTPFDDNCDGDDNDEDALACSDYYEDTDGDGYGQGAPRCLCTVEGLFEATQGGDCDETADAINPGAVEVCPESYLDMGAVPVDEDCDGFADDASASGAMTWYADGDGDGYGDPNQPLVACAKPTDYVGDASDCDDLLAGVNPGAAEARVTIGIDDKRDGDDNDVWGSGCSAFFLDSDGDMFGTEVGLCLCEATGTYSASVAGDCDDTKDTVNPDKIETCATNYDDNCDGDANDIDAIACTNLYFDGDSDGSGAGEPLCLCVAQGLFEATQGEDCDDGDYAINSAALEVCDGVDNNCDGYIDDADPQVTGQSTWYQDTDGDSYGDADASLLTCGQPADHVLDGTDCDDLQTGVNPGATETCDTVGIDDDCDGDANEVDAAGCTDFYIDSDGDDYGAGTAVCTCTVSATHTAAEAGDCDDGSVLANPGASETCATAADENCDGVIDEEDALACLDYYQDRDSDGYGQGLPRCLCAADGLFAATVDGDCDDTAYAINPGAVEVCTADGVDGLAVDENCDGFIDEASSMDALIWYADGDGDGFGDADAQVIACAQPIGFIGDASDCDDLLVAVNPGATETCATVDIDDDCDGEANEVDALGCVEHYADEDDDSYGAGVGSCICTATADFEVTDKTDCDDAAGLVNPGATETCSTVGIDDDCSGSDNDLGAINCVDYYTDVDGDGFGMGLQHCLCETTGDYTATVSGDCDDALNQVNPDGTEVCTAAGAGPGSGGVPIDEDCDTLIDEEDAADAGLWYLDVDGDGYGDPSDSHTACNPQPGYVAADNDGDGIYDPDCDDSLATGANIFPGQIETCATTYDDNCDGDSNDEGATNCSSWYFDGDYDGHGIDDSRCMCAPEGFYTAGTIDDCDDVYASIRPSATETCATALVDDDCDGDDNELDAVSCVN
jgi:hypothetical protein